MAKKTANESILREKTVGTAKAYVAEDARYKVLRRVSVISIVVIVAICLLFNVLFDLLLDRKLTFDSSSVQSNSIGIASKDVLKDLNKKVEIYGLFDKSDTSIEWREYFIPILEDYEAKADGKITVSYIDPDVNPYIYTELDPDQIYSLQEIHSAAGGVFVFKCEDTIASLNPYHALPPDSEWASMYGVYKVASNDVELNITGLIMHVTSDNPMHAYYLTGHQEADHVNMDKILKARGFVTEELNLGHQNSSIPSNCNLLLILQPRQDISEFEREQLKLYLDNGGKLIIVNDYDIKSTTISKTSFARLNEVTRRMGISMENAILHEQDTSYLIHSDDPYASLVKLNETVADWGFDYSKMYSSSNNRYISVAQEKAQNVFVLPLLMTSEKTSVDFQDMSISSDATIGSYPVVLLGYESDNERSGMLVVIGTSDFASDSYYDQKSLQDPNSEFIRILINRICPASVNVPSIPAKTIPNYTLQKTLSSNEITLWSIIVMTVIPLGCLIIGGVVYKKRRHL